LIFSIGAWFSIGTRYELDFCVRLSSVEYIALWAVSLTAVLLALAALAVALVNYLKPEKNDAEVRSAVRGLELEVTDLGDRLTHWQRRSASRGRRDLAGDAGPESGRQDGNQSSEADRKSALRTRARQLGLFGVKQ
jgi:hypothetical protein